MTPEERSEAVTAIHASPLRTVVMLAGGTASIADLLGVPGGSRTVFEALAPYSRPALSGWLGYLPSNAVTEEVAADMAVVTAVRAGEFAVQMAEVRAARVAAEGGGDTDGGDAAGGATGEVVLSGEAVQAALGPIVGLSATSALATDPPRRGEDRAWLAVAKPSVESDGSVDATVISNSYLTFQATDRAGQERELADAVLAALAEQAAALN